MRPVKAMLEATSPFDGTKRSPLLTALPKGVDTETLPDVAARGTGAEILVVVDELTEAWALLKDTLLFVVVVLKFVPLIAIGLPGSARAGVKLVMVGGPDRVPPTVKGILLVAEPDGVVTAMGPVVAPAGTLVTICVRVDDETLAAVPLNVTAFWLGVVLKPVP
jgi:hypothetical protein